jgi:hypothetical protein
MSKRVVTTLVVTGASVAALALGPGAALASQQASPGTVVPIVMADPGCHWFSVGGKNKASLTVKGPTTFRNLDEAALVFVGKGFNKHLAVGKSLTVAKPGVYHITMVGQAPHDNHLKLVVG